MANNKNTTDTESTLLQNKILELTNKLNIAAQTADGTTQEELINEAVDSLSIFFTRLSKPIFSPVKSIVNHKPDLDIYNSNFSDIQSDLNILFAEYENVESIILGHFNFMVTDSNKILSGLKQVYSKLGDYILFSKDITGDSIFFSDSFNNQNRIDVNSSLLNNIQCNIDQSQGIVTLPVLNKNIFQITNQPIINSNSNGVSGNQLQDPQALSADINRIIDNTPDTWFEYERLLDEDDGIPLILDITISLSDPSIINYIRINPNNFGTKNPVSIDTIETSLDGQSYLSIKDDVPINGFATQDEDNTFVLSPSTSKFAGQGIYSFNPRKVKYVHLVFRQSSTYSVGAKLRYAIGIRDIEISAITYDSVGEIVSVNYLTDNIINKVGLITNQNPISDSQLASINHFISPDNGLTWNQIIPEDFDTVSDITRIINFNTIDKDSINTSTPVQSLRYKSIFNRNKDAFNTGIVQNKDNTVSTMELHSIPTQTPFDIALNTSPANNSIIVLDPSFGSRGIDHKKYIIGTGTGNAIEFNLPFSNIPYDVSKTFSNNQYNLTRINSEEIRVNGQLWTRGFLIQSSSTDLVYELDNITGKIKFGDGIHGKAVPSSNSIDIKFSPERLLISSQASRSGSLLFPTSRDKNSLVIKIYSAFTAFSEVIKKNTNIIKLNNKNIKDVINFSDNTVFATRKDFINGSSELTTNGDWSIDTINGIVYSKLPSSSTNDTSILYQYFPELILNSTDWDFNSDGSIVLNSNVFSSINVSAESIPAGIKYFNLANIAIVQGTVNFQDKIVFNKEVPYINGRIELSNNIKTTEKINSSSPVLNNIIYSLRMPIVQDPSYDVVFSNKSIFTSRVNSLGELVSTGQYYIDLVNRKIYLYSAVPINDLGSVSYYYQNQIKSIQGLYSINYQTGEVFTAIVTGSNTTVDYQYTNILVSYPIARQISSDNFSFNNGTITIAEREILTRIDLNSIPGSTQSNFYQIVFDIFTDTAANIDELEPFFTPVLKDYAIKFIPGTALLF